MTIWQQVVKNNNQMYLFLGKKGWELSDKVYIFPSNKKKKRRMKERRERGECNGCNLAPHLHLPAPCFFLQHT